MWNSYSKDKIKTKALQINECQLTSHSKVRYLYALNNENNADKIDNIVVIIHGISRNALEIIEAFSQIINENTILIAPIFSKEYATDYQRLGRRNKGPRADYILDAIINEVKAKYKMSCDKFDLFGFSAGAQFAHRYAFAHPAMVKKVAIVAAGWYTLPALSLKYPYGLKLKGEFSDISFELQRLLRVKFRVYIGEKDCSRDKSLNKARKIDTLQGQNRIERAEKWVGEMQNQFSKNHIKNHVDLVVLKNTAHDFKGANSHAQLCEKVYDWFSK